MQAVILAAGVGSRLHRVSNGLPKCLLPIGDRPLIEHQLEALSDAGIGKVLMVVGYKADEVRKTVGNRVEFIENPRFEETNSLYSLWLAKDWVKGPFVLVNSDLLFHPDILHRLLTKGGSAAAFDSTSSRGQEQTKVAVHEGRVIDIGKDLPAELSRGESLGLLCFDSKGSEVLFSRVEALIRNGAEQSWVMEAVRSTCSAVPMRAINIAGLPWAELDFPYDLDRAHREVWPAIWKSRWKRIVYWRRTRWVALFLAASGLAYGGWMVSSKLNSETVEWVNEAPVGGNKVLLALPEGTQTWWIASRMGPLELSLQGPSDVRAEVRLLMPPGTIQPGRYVLQVSMNEKPHTWEAFKATPDPRATVLGYVVGDRDRLEFTIPEGRHRIQVALLAGTSENFLVQIRQPEPSTPEEEEEEE